MQAAGIDADLERWLLEQPMFVVATAPLDETGHVNCSPKGNRDEFVVIDPLTVAYLDQTGSGIETIAHLRENGRLTIMFCAFTGNPRIVRLQGRGEYVLRADPAFDGLLASFGADAGSGARAIIVAHLDRVADSCGYGFPLMGFRGHRRALDAWADKKGVDGIARYQQENNLFSIDHLVGLDPEPAKDSSSKSETDAPMRSPE